MTVQEGLDRSIIVNTEPAGQSTGRVKEGRIRVPRIYSIYKSLEYTARTYLLKFNLN